jgi:hypothetical protein
MTTPALVTSSLVAMALVAGAAAVDRRVAQDTFADTRPVIEFQRAADNYAFLHRQVERRIGLAHRRAGEAEDVVAAAELATGIIAERAKLPESVLFTPAVVTAFRHLAANGLHAPGCDPGELRSGVWEMFHETNAPATGTRRVNACVAAALPALPVELEYRSAGTVLLVVDAHANLVVDVLPALLAGSDIR